MVVQENRSADAAPVELCGGEEVVSRQVPATVALVCFGDLGREPRVHRQLSVLRRRYRVVAFGFAPSRFDDVTFVPLGQRPKTLLQKVRAALQLLSGRYEERYWELAHVRDLVEKLQGVRADVIVAHDIDTLPAVVRCSGGARILYDAHDYAPRQFEDRLYFRLFLQRYSAYLCKTYIPRVARMITVCDSLAEAYGGDTGVSPVVITNAPDYQDLVPRLRGEAERKIRLVHHGAAIRSRRLENMIRAMDFLDERFELDLLLVENSPGYVSELQRMADQRRNVSIRPPVPMPELPKVLNQYDVGVFLLEPVNFNYLSALPNKFFEFIQGRLAVAISPSPEMARVVREHGCGVIAEGFTAQEFAAALRDLDHERINSYKERSHEAARLLSSERNNVLFATLVEELLEV